MSQAEAADPRFRAALEALAARGRFGIRLGLGRTRALLRRLGDPQEGLPGVLIGGTNGKGSVQALVAGALQQGGYRVGQTPKPHLVSYRERIVVDGMPISARDFADLAEEVIGHADKVAPRLGPPTEFELLTAAAFTWFRRQAVDTAVVEVGMGGRLDATNVWQGGVSAITNVALDHTQHLGPTIVHIAREKAPIVKRGDRAVVTGAEGAALAVITRRARRLAVPVRVVEALPVTAFDRSGLRLEVPGGRAMRVGLLGRHQAANAAIALAVLDELAAAGIAQVGRHDVERAFAEVRWPGRLELLSLAADDTAHAASVDGPHRSQPDVLLDGAHNAHGAQALAAALEELRPLLSPGRPTLLMGVLVDKDVSGMVAPLAACPALHDARVVATSVPDAPRSLPATDLAAVWKAAARDAAHDAINQRNTSIHAVDEPADALSQAMDHSRQAGGPLIVCGSLYLVGFVRGRLVADIRAAPDPA